MSCVLISLCSCSNKEISSSLGKVRLNIETYRAGLDQVTHPSVIQFDEKWNGYKYWMAYTPYPFGDGEEENPCIAVSNDLLYWDTPNGMVNPIADNEETGCNELKDAHILYRDDLDRIEVWYLGRLSESLGGDNKSLLLFRKYTYDGITWSDYEIMTSTEYLSPSVIWKDNKYQFWGIGYSSFNNTGTFVYSDSTDGKNWENQRQCTIDGADHDLPIWHGSVSFFDNEYHFVYIESSNASQKVLYCHSSDGIDFKNNSVIVENNSQSNWKILYRPFVMKENNEYVLFYGVITDNNEWYITRSIGEDITHLTGLDIADQENMKPLRSQVTDTKSMKYIIKRFIHSIKTGIRIELFALLPVLCILYKVFKKKRIRELWLYVLCLGITVAYVFMLLKPETASLVIAYLTAGAVQAICMALLSEKIMSLISNRQ